MKSKSLVPVLVIVAALAVSACSKQKFVIQSGVGLTAENSMSAFFVGGIGQSHRINASEICGGSDKVVSVEGQTTFVNGLLSFMSGNLFTPRQYRIICRS
jgi:hypothetical protein